MTTVAVFNLKGGVGKTSVAVNLAAAAAWIAGKRTVLWDLDGQAAATFILARPGTTVPSDARALLDGKASLEQRIAPTVVDGLDLLPADRSLHDIDEGYGRLAKKDRLQGHLAALHRRYDLVLLDCSPGLGATNTQLLGVASLLVLPMLPALLSERAVAETATHLERSGIVPPPILPVFNMVDMRRSAHRAAVESHADYPVVPSASVVEQMAARKAPVLAYAGRSAAGRAFEALWARVADRV